ncbi:menaquinone biosynthetic enzyme MqnA/MqnD family protein [Lewinella sp. 4G2]|uniref:menaquinone biosynthetic enzyme MqnA/MqnD family protein n=1 Tax=Lewinella sp. 4G2 TaxID=1803372 RepID=UPI0007B4D252|nr:menaquinone biosynthesis protein [Lewinella sp. 4G2]OAV44630.1 ABC transporter substrate-binding protein [Lewinella sp. 4G2]
MVSTTQPVLIPDVSAQNPHRLVAVSYLNTKPLLYGLLRSSVQDQLEMDLAIPSECARRLVAGEADIGLVPVAIIPELPSAHIISDYCIGTNGPVATVCIYGDVPIHEMTAIYLDHHSRTSAMLTRLLLEEYWSRAPTILAAKPGYIDSIGGTVGGLVIGDRAIGLNRRFAYTYDLGEAWLQHTGLPFVFAAWVATKPLPPNFTEAFNRALASGLEHLPELQLLLSSPDPEFSLVDYFNRHIDYRFDEPKQRALDRFLTYVRSVK